MDNHTKILWMHYLFYPPAQHVDLLNKQGSHRRKKLVLLPDQHAPGRMLRADGDKTQIWTAVDCQSSIQAKSASQSLFHQQYRIGKKGIAEGNRQFLFLPV